MKKSLFSFMLIIVGWQGFAQQSRSSNIASDLIAKIISVIGLKPNFEVQSSNVPNAAAVMNGGKRYILYNPNFIVGLVKISGNEWSAVSVLAHEIGHHLNGHTLDNHGSIPSEELEADEFSGFVLRRMGATLDEAQLATRMAADAISTSTHPGQQDRLIAIERGWNSANDQSLGKVDLAINKPTSVSIANSMIQTPKTSVILDEKYIAANVYFSGDEEGKYFVTKKMNLVKVENNQLYLIAKVSALNSTSYPLLIYDEDDQTKLFVDAGGSILTPKGKKVGRLEMH